MIGPHSSASATASVRARAWARGRAATAAAALVAIALGAPASPVRADLEPYASSNDPLATSPSTDDGSFGAWHNPAAWGVPERGGLDVALFYGAGDLGDLRAWQAGMGRGLGISVRHRQAMPAVAQPRVLPVLPFYYPLPGARPSLPSLTEYQIGIGSGNGAGFGGFAYHFSGPGKSAWRRSNFLSAGQIARPDRHVSIGWASRWAPATGDVDQILDVGFRPTGTPLLTLFADGSVPRFFEWSDGSVGFGAVVRPTDGIEVSGRWRNDERFQLSAGVTLARFGARVTPTFRRNVPASSPGFSNPTTTEQVGTWYSFRLSPPVRGIDLERRTSRNSRYLGMDLRGRAVYQSYRWFDGGSKPLRDLTEQIRFAREDPTVGGIAIRLSGFEANASMIWELRRSLLALKQAGKKVLISCDNLDQRSYYLACVADYLVIDPIGGLFVPGVQASRTYMKDLLAKLGIGFDEWRFYKYKSALEIFSRTDFSAADREQFDALVRATYEELATGIAASGRVTRAEFDRVVNEEPYLTARRLKELGWVDALGRGEELEEAVKAMGGRGKPWPYRKLYDRRWQPDEAWGSTPTIALVYLIGDCAMDTGIRARATAPAMKRLRENRNVKAVVLRVDSPGGDPVASDIVAEETRKLREAGKPAFVSQGRVAGSGGYWISMDGEEIAAGPFTITGSIGVIGGWAWNDGFGKKTGLASDRVQVGKSADLLGGLRIPLLGAVLPERNLDEAERRLMHGVLDELYGRFTASVAEARRLDVARVRELAEGRIYDGSAAVKNHLVDRIASLEETIEAAKGRAGIPRGRRVRILEVPPRPLLRVPGFFPEVPGLSRAWGAVEGSGSSSEPARLYEIGVVQQILDHPGRPLLAIPGSLLPLEEEPIR